ncbi:MAG: hypothetical protein GYB66_01830 [Chloroflexi bacterium]|nr:hypothetical protein [Chloroflexota bacterium]
MTNLNADDQSPEKHPSGDKAQVERYQQLVLEYEKLAAEIDGLLMRNDGGTEEMSDEDYRRYRKLADQRDEVHNQLRHLESILFDDN